MVKAIRVGPSEYLFFSSGDFENETGSIYYMMKDDGADWSEPNMVMLNTSVYKFFDCIFDEEKDEFVIFFCHWNETEASIYSTSGALDHLDIPELVIGEYRWTHTPSMAGPVSHSSFISHDGTIYLFYCWRTGVSENLNDLFLVTSNGDNWTEPQEIGMGNSPFALEDATGRIHLYSNLWTYTSGAQPCIDEWTYDGVKWKMNEITRSADGWNANPFVIEDSKGTKFLFYDFNVNEPGTKADVMVQIQRKGDSWSTYHSIVDGRSRYGFINISGIIEGTSLTIFYVEDGELFELEGSIGA